MAQKHLEKQNFNRLRLEKLQSEMDNSKRNQEAVKTAIQA